MPTDQVRQINSFIERHLLRSSLRVESLVWLLFIGVLLYILRSILFKGNEIFAHDTLYWYPLYQFFAENIIQGRFPYWNPYTHGGEPFFPAIHAGTRLLDPTTFIVILLGKMFKVNLLILFAWDLVVKCILSAIGTYILLRRWAEHRISQLSLIPILLFSSFTFISFRQNGLLFNFMWTPFIVYFLFEIIFFKKNSWSNWLGMVLFIGISAQSYHFTGVCIFLLFLGVGLILFNRELLIDTYQTKKFFFKVGASLIVIMLLWLPVFAAYLEKDKLFSPARFSRSPLYEFSLNDPEARKKFHESARKFNYQLSYQEIEDSGSTSSVANFIQFINPYGYYWWIEYGASEASIYVGMLVFLIGLIGIIGGRHPLKKTWLLVLICSALFILGPNGVLHRLLYYIYPPVQLARHTHNFTTYFILSFLFFYIIGCNIILNKIPNLPIYLKFSDILPDWWWRWRWLNYLEGILFSFWIMLCFNPLIEKMYNSPYDVSQRITRWAIRFLIMGCAGLFFLAINTVWNKKLKLITTYLNKYDTHTMILATTLFSYVILLLIEYNRFYYLYYPIFLSKN